MDMSAIDPSLLIPEPSSQTQAFARNTIEETTNKKSARGCDHYSVALHAFSDWKIKGPAEERGQAPPSLKKTRNPVKPPNMTRCHICPIRLPNDQFSICNLQFAIPALPNTV